MSSRRASRAEIRRLKLELLNAIEPLLSPTLPPTPPANDDEDVRPAPLPAPKSILKRKLDVDASPGTVQGLGLIGSAGEEIKRQKLSPTSKPSPLTAKTPMLGPESRPSTPDLRASARHPPSSPMLGGVRNTEWRTDFSSTRLRKLAELYRGKGRDLKHKGDRLTHSASMKATALPLVLLTEALLFYVFSFWCDDQAARGCVPSNWRSMVALLKHVKSESDRAGYPLLAAICLRLEAHTVYTLSIYEQKELHQRSTQYLITSSSTSSSSTLSGTQTAVDKPSPSSQGSPDSLKPESAGPGQGHSPPPPSAPHPARELLKVYTKAGEELFRWPKLWEEAALTLSVSMIGMTLPNTWKQCTNPANPVDPSSCVLPVKPWRYAWPMDIIRTMSIPHSISFLRSVLEEWALKEGVEYLPAIVVEEE